MSKGQGEIQDSLFLVLATGSFLFVMFVFVNQAFSELVKRTALESAEVVAKDLGSFITISAAAPEEIKITHKPSTILTYNVDIKGRVISVSSLLDGKPVEGPAFFGIKVAEAKWFEKTAVDGLETKLENSKVIVVEKSVSEGKYVYKLKKEST